ncbi:hypothetical protein ES703_103261 [subsurface metagenome]
MAGLAGHDSEYNITSRVTITDTVLWASGVIFVGLIQRNSVELVNFINLLLLTGCNINTIQNQN